MTEEYRFAACRLPIRQRQERGCRLTVRDCRGCPHLALVEEKLSDDRLGKSKSYVDQRGDEISAEKLSELWK